MADPSRSRSIALMLTDTPLGWLTRGDVAALIAEADDRVAAAERTAALATYEAALARFEYQRLANRRAVRLATELAASTRPAKLRSTASRLRSAAGPVDIGDPPQPSPVPPRNDRTRRASRTLVDRGLLPPRPTRVPRHGHLRVLHLGVVSRFGGVVPHIPLDHQRWGAQLDEGADLLLIEPPDAADGWDPFDGGLPDVLAAADAAGIPSVRISSGPGTEPAHERPGTARAELREGAGDIGDPFPVSVDTSVFNPLGWRRDPPDPVVALLAAPVGEAGRRLLEGFDPPVTVVVPTDVEVAADVRFSRRVSTTAGVRRSLIRAGVLLDHPSWRADAATAMRRWSAALACGTPVVTCDATAVADELPPGVIDVAESDLLDTVHGLLVDPDLRERHGIVGRRWALRNAARETRLRQLLDRVDIPLPRELRTTVLISTHRPSMVDHALDSVARQTRGSVDVALVLHGDAFDHVDLPSRSDLVSSVTRAPGSWTLGDCLNAGLDHATGELVAKMDDDDHYGPEHLADLVDGWGYSGADVVGKPVEFVHLAERNITVRRPTARVERDRRHVGGPTPLAARELLLRHRFLRLPNRVDSTLYERVLADGGRIYGIHSRDFVLSRHGNAHAWDVDDAEFLDTAVSKRDGLALDLAGSDPGRR